ncbi:riboflavin synthase [Candidatus Woesearchaeota archaeon]|nr:riboflavin synthase [Candidatus Woesearchaeota archaeon]
MRIGIADTMFSRVDMFRIAEKAIEDSMEEARIERYTVPGVKDLPVAAKKLLEEYGCDIAVALGMPGDKEIDKVCAHEASQGLINAQLLANKHIIEVFVHLDEAEDAKELLEIARNRTYEHTMNAIALLKGKEKLSKNAGKGIRQGKSSVGGIG